MCILVALSCGFISLLVAAEQAPADNALAKHDAEKVVNLQGVNQQGVTQQGKVEQAVLPHKLAQQSPEVGQHVMANMDAGSMILSLLMVLALVVICALLLKRFNLTPQGGSQLKVVSSLSLGAKERVVVIQAGEQQLLLGVTAQQVTLIERLAEPLVVKTLDTAVLPKSLLSFLATKKF